MTKRQLIDEIVALNQTAQPCFLSRFDDADLGEYLNHLRTARLPRLCGDPRRFDRYFRNVPVVDNIAAGQAVEQAERKALIGTPQRLVDDAQRVDIGEPKAPAQGLEYQADPPVSGQPQEPADAAAPAGARKGAMKDSQPAAAAQLNNWLF